MQCIGNEHLQLGKTGWFLGSWDNLLSGALEVEIYICTGCGKVEFFSSDAPDTEDRIAQVACPYCNELHDIDDSKCPHCHKRL